MSRHEPGAWFLMDKRAVERIARHPRARILLLVYTVLCFHADKAGRCFPSYRRLLDLTGIVSRANLAEALQSLEDLEIIRRERRKGRVNTYLILDRTGSPGEPVVRPTGSVGEPHQFSGRTTAVLSGNHTSSPGEPEEEVLKRNQEEDLSKRKEGRWQEKEEVCQFIKDLKGLVAPIEKRFVERLAETLVPGETFRLVEECYLADPLAFRKRGIMPLKKLAERC
ncbi:MAG TPA: helix-turn-helix domain-containing protein [Atribacteraceae bacterium]|nr:helix-turn-helix domain-containing protein [Atribacteraceae bacterium]